MAKNFARSGKKVRPKTAVKGKRYRCALCRKRSPKPVKTSAPWYCQNCLKEKMTKHAVHHWSLQHRTSVVCWKAHCQ